MKIKCVEMVRDIRDDMAKRCKGKSSAEIIDFIRRQARHGSLWAKFHKTTPQN